MSEYKCQDAFCRSNTGEDIDTYCANCEHVNLLEGENAFLAGKVICLNSEISRCKRDHWIGMFVTILFVFLVGLLRDVKWS